MSVLLASPAARGADLAALLTAACTWALTLAGAWLALLVVLVALEPLTGRDLATPAGCPAWLRATLLALCGLGVAGALLAPAEAADHPVHPGHTRQQALRGPADGLPVPDRTTSPAARPARPARAARPPTVVVVPGDSLWRIAERRLPADASAAEVDHGWRRLYERNRARIGADPDLIEPGTRLAVTTAPLEETP